MALIVSSAKEMPPDFLIFTLQDAFFPVPSAAFAVMTAVPVPTPFTVPLLLTVAIFLFEVVHTTSLLPPALVSTEAFSFNVLPFAMEAEVLSSFTLVTLPLTTFTVTTAFFFLFFEELTVIFAVPAFLPVITPLAVTDAIFGFELLYFTFLLADLSGETVTVVFRVAFLPFASLMVLLPVNESVEVTFFTIIFDAASAVLSVPANHARALNNSAIPTA
ncbi:hypothetical protein IMSAGC013_01100 [Lachnospiraceae bacterium]|nr:hypothetical protein IMSAGC013_01100 [Lachnospiraceae bacterium]